MERNKLKEILQGVGFSVFTVNSILQGKRKPSYEKILILEEKFGIPFTAWRDIKSYIRNDTPKQCTKTNTPKNEEVA